MATDEKINIVPTSDEVAIISTINNNFKVLTQRIKNQNLNFSYLDMLRIAKIFNYRSGSPSDTEAYQQFISTIWAVLDNYSGVYLQMPSGIKINMGGYTALNGDYLVKLPGGEFLYIPGTNPQIYYPSVGSNPFIITYTLADVTATTATVTITVPNIQNNHQHLCNEAVDAGGLLSSFTTSTATTSDKLKDVRWYTNDGEEVLWDHSYHGCKNMTNMPLTAMYIYDDSSEGSSEG